MSRIRADQHEATSTDAETSSHPAGGMGLGLFCAAPEASATAVQLHSGMTFGRGESCSVRIVGAAVSRQHAKIEFRGALWWCDDMGSRNGTFLNGRSVQTTPIAPGDVLRIGEYVWVVTCVPAAVPPRPFEELAPRLLGGESLQRALEPARLAARSSLPIILEGETGTGKERVATAIHRWSGRRGGFVAVNCAALVGSLAEAELFGYRKGAFTGAERSYEGLIRAADRGTLLLDEVCELPMATQAKLLRVLEEQAVVPLGESRPVPVDVRVLAAAQEPLDAMVAQRRFRADLLARLKGLVVRLPPLRERREDAAVLLRVFLQELTGGRSPRLQSRFVEAVLVHSFPDNVRGLWQLTRWLACVHGHEPELRRAHLPAEVCEASGREATATTRAAPHRAGVALRQGHASPTPRTATEDDWPSLLEALKASNGNVVQAAAQVGLSRHQAYRLMRGQGFTDLETLRR